MRHVPISFAGPQEFAVVVYGVGMNAMAFAQGLARAVGITGGAFTHLELCPFLAVQTDSRLEADFVCGELLAAGAIVGIVRRAFGGAISPQLPLPPAATRRLPRPHATLC